MRSRTRIQTNHPAIVLYHRDSADCPTGPRAMMGDEHRAGCAEGIRCQTARPTRGGAVRAEYYARVDQGDGVRAKYLCPGCAETFAQVTGIPFVRGH